MTALGKVLVFFNLLFALVTGGLIVMVFLTRTNWKNGMEAAILETKAAQATAKAEIAQKQQEMAAFANTKKQLEQEIANLNINIAGKTVEINNEKAKAEAARKNEREQLAASEAASKEIARLQQERN